MTTPEHPAVDVVVATHQRPVLLRQAIAAIRGQDYPGQVRCIVVFDRSDPDLTLVEDDVHRPVEVIANHRNPGLAGARNSGILQGTAPLVAFCDDDDRWQPEKLRRQVAAMADADLTCVSGITIEYGDTRTDRVPLPAELTVAALARNRTMAAHPSTVVVRRQALTGPIGLVDEDIPGSYAEDFDWILRAAKAGPIAVAPEPLVAVAWGGSQFSTQWRTIVQAIDYGFEKHPEFLADRRASARLLGRRAFALAALRDRSALRAAARTARTHPGELRAYLAIAVALRLVRAERLLHLAHRRGHGI